MKKLLYLIIACTFCNSCQKNDIGIQTQDDTFPNTAASSNAVEIIWDFPVSGIFYNECCNEAVRLFGTAHFVRTRNVVHFEVHDIRGIGLSTGFSYTAISPSVYTNVFYSLPVEGLLSLFFNMKNDNGCGFKLKVSLRLHINVNGDTVVNFENVQVMCE